jgi:hypothetical protein
MAQVGASFVSGAGGAQAGDEVTGQIPIAVHSCSRIGRVANPPGFSFADWFRSARRR